MSVHRSFLFNILVILMMLLPLVMWGCVSYHMPENVDITSGGLDTDKDGLPDQQEIALGVDPKNPDTDGDGLKDGAEISMGLDPTNPDTDGDGVLDADDSWPKLNNNTLYLYIGISAIVITVTVLALFHLKCGLTKGRKEAVKKIRERREEEEALFQRVRNRIMGLAQQKHGWVTVDEGTKELAIDSRLVVKYFTKLKARKEGPFYRFPDIEKSFNK